MEENNDVIEQLKVKNQEIFLNKKIIDIDTSMDSLLLFYSNYTKNLANDINNYISSIYGIDSNSEKGKIMYNTITSFFAIYHKKLKEILFKKMENIKSRINNISDDDYNKELRYMSIKTVNLMSDYYFQNIDMLINELTEEADNTIKNKISNYFSDSVYVKIMNVLRDQFNYSIKLISNNNEENIQVIQTINEKTIK